MTNEQLEAFNKISSEMTEAYSNMLRTSMNVPEDWKYFDTPFVTKENMSKLLETLGTENYRVAVSSAFKGDARATLFISPAGIENARAALGKKDEQ